MNLYHHDLSSPLLAIFDDAICSNMVITTVALQVEAIRREDDGVGEEQDGVDYVADTLDEDEDFDEEIEAGDDGNDGSVALQAEAFKVKMMVVNCLMATIYNESKDNANS